VHRAGKGQRKPARPRLPSFTTALAESLPGAFLRSYETDDRVHRQHHRAIRYYCCWAVSVNVGFVAVVTISILIALIEHWTFLEALYFAVITVTTVGFGDLTPRHPVSKILTCVLIAASLALVAAALARMQQAIMHNAATAAESAKLKHEETVFACDAPDDDNNNNQCGGGERSWWGSVAALVGEQETPKQRLAQSMCALVLLCGISVASLCAFEEDLPTVDAIYFSVITITTVGFGDVVPKKRTGRCFTIMLVTVGPLLLGRAITSFVELYAESIELLDDALTVRERHAMRALAQVEDAFDADLVEYSESAVAATALNHNEADTDRQHHGFRQPVLSNRRSVLSNRRRGTVRPNERRGHRSGSRDLEMPIRTESPSQVESNDESGGGGSKSSSSSSSSSRESNEGCARGGLDTGSGAADCSRGSGSGGVTINLAPSVVEAPLRPSLAARVVVVEDLMPADFALAYLVERGALSQSALTDAALAWAAAGEREATDPTPPSPPLRLAAAADTNLLMPQEQEQQPRLSLSEHTPLLGRAWRDEMASSSKALLQEASMRAAAANAEEVAVPTSRREVCQPISSSSLEDSGAAVAKVDAKEDANTENSLLSESEQHDRTEVY